MEFFKANPKIRFMKQRLIAAVFSAIIFVASVAALIANGLTLGLDFTGGTQVVVTFPQSVNASALRTASAANEISDIIHLYLNQMKFNIIFGNDVYVFPEIYRTVNQ